MPYVVEGRRHYAGLVMPSQAEVAVAEASIVSGEAPDEEWKDVRRYDPPSKKFHSKQKPKKGRERKSSTSPCLNPPKGSITQKRSGNNKIKKKN